MSYLILKTTPYEAVIKATSNVSATANIALANLVYGGETFDAANALVTIQEIQWSCTAGGSGEISRLDGIQEGGEIPFAGNGRLTFDGYTDTELQNKTVRIKTDNAVVYVRLKKSAGYIPVNRQVLADKDK